MGRTDGTREAPSARGFSTRAIRAASRGPRFDQAPTAVPICFSATFAAADADELEGAEARLAFPVSYPGLPSHPQHALATRQFRGGSGMFAFELVGDRAVGPAFIDALTVPDLTASLGSVHTMVVHPPTTTHRQLDDAALAEAGIGPGLLRCSVGLEDVEDLIGDFERALGAVRGAATGVAAAAVT